MIGIHINAIYVHFWLPKIEMKFCEIPFPKSIVYSDVVLDKLWQWYKSLFPSKNAERKLTCESCWRAFPLGLEIFETFELFGSM